MKLKKSVLLALALTAFAPSTITATDMWGSDTERSLVFSPGDYNSKFYRIPALGTAKDGTLIALADKRIESNGDLPGVIDIVCRRSSDGGRTWSEYITVAEHDSLGGYSDPSIVVDRKSGDILAFCTHGNGIWGDTPGHVTMIRSTDNGLTWEKPRDISLQLYNTRKAPLQKVAGAFASSGSAYQLKSGRIMVIVPLRFIDEKPVKFHTYAIYSDDNGKNWKVSKNPGTTDGDESKVTQLADGTLLMSIRNRYKGPRIFSRSKDNGVTWSEPFEGKMIPDPACNGDILNVSAATDTKCDLLLQSLPGHPSERRDVTVYVSRDGGETWPVHHKIVTSPSAYSSMELLPDGYVGILTEEDAHDAGFRIWFTRLPLARILEGDK